VGLPQLGAPFSSGKFSREAAKSSFHAYQHDFERTAQYIRDNPKNYQLR
jgi:hypothetical protein